MGTKNAGAKQAAKKHPKTEEKKPGTAFAWKLQAEAIEKLDKRVEDNEHNITETARYAEQVNEFRKRGTASIHQDILTTERRQEYLYKIVRGNFFWMTMLGLTMAALNMALLHLLVNR